MSSQDLENVPDDEDEESGPLREGATRLEDVPETTCLERLSGLMATVSVGSSIAAAVMNPEMIIILGALFCALLGPYQAWQQRKLTDIRALAETSEALGGEVDFLSQENDRLEKNVAELGETTGRLEVVGEAFDLLTAQQGESIEALAETIADSRKTLQKMKKNLKATIFQNLFSIIMGADKDGDLYLDDDEIEQVIEQMSNIDGVHLHKENFRRAIVDSGRSMDAVMDIVKGVLEEREGENKLFQMEEDEEDDDEEDDEESQ